MRGRSISMRQARPRAQRVAWMIFAGSWLIACGSTSGNNPSPDGGIAQGGHGAGGGTATGGGSNGAGAPGDAGPPDASGVNACSAPALRVVPVKSTAELTAAISGAMPGDRIEMADGTYAGGLVATTAGTAD